MAGESRMKFYRMLLGNTMGVDEDISTRLCQRLQLTEVVAMDNCDVIIAFAPVVSRAGTDIEAALHKIPRTSKPVVLAVLHFTHDEYYIAPQSRWHINRDGVFAVDFLCYEDLGLLRSLRNDEAMKEVTDHLISIGASPPTQPPERTRSQGQSYTLMFIIIVLIIAILLAVLIGVIIYAQKWQNHIVPTRQPNVTMNIVTNSTTSSTVSSTMSSTMNITMHSTINSTTSSTMNRTMSTKS